MKKLVCVCLLFGSTLTGLSAQKIQIDAGVGFGILQGHCPGHYGFHYQRIFLPLRKNNYPIPTGIYIEGAYRIKKNIDLGVHFSTSSYTEEYGVTLSGDDLGEVKRMFHTFTVTGDYYWDLKRDKPNLELYSGLQLGISVFNDVAEGDIATEDLEEEGVASVGMQVTAIGARYGNQIAVQAELGFEYKGICSIGLSGRF